MPEDKSKLQEAWTINSNDTRLEYLIRDAHHGLRGNTIKISLNIEYMPIVGPFFKVSHILSLDSSLRDDLCDAKGLHKRKPEVMNAPMLTSLLTYQSFVCL